jgi:hypothetical protein
MVRAPPATTVSSGGEGAALAILWIVSLSIDRGVLLLIRRENSADLMFGTLLMFRQAQRPTSQPASGQESHRHLTSR